MKAKVKVSHRDMKGNCYKIKDVACHLITLEYIVANEEDYCAIQGQKILVDFALREVEIQNKGNYVSVYRNQAKRDGKWLGYCEANKGYILEYEMPNGRTFKNLVKNPFNTNEYTTKIK